MGLFLPKLPLCISYADGTRRCIPLAARGHNKTKSTDNSGSCSAPRMQIIVVDLQPVNISFSFPTGPVLSKRKIPSLRIPSGQGIAPITTSAASYRRAVLVQYRGRRAEHDDPVSLRAELICLLGFLFRCLLWIDIQAVSHIFHG